MILNLYPEEKVVLELRRHWFIFFLETMFLVVFLCLPFVFLIIFEEAAWLTEHPVATDWIGFIVATWFLFIWVTFFILWTNFYLDAWIITNRRILDIEQYRLFSREISEFRIENIQDVTVNIKGFIPTILGYGDILVEAAGEQKHCTIKDAPHPEYVKNIISKLQSDISHRLDK